MKRIFAMFAVLALMAGMAMAQPSMYGSYGLVRTIAPENAGAMTRDIEVPDAVFGKLKQHYSDAQIVELTVLIGAYNMHTRVGRALRIDPETD